MKKSNRTLSALAGLAIILIVLGHSGGLMPDAIKLMANNDPVYGKFISFINWIKLYHIPIFFTLSGFLFKYSNPKKKSVSFLDLVKKKTVRLLLPYFFISTIVYPIKIVFNQFAAFPVSVSFAGYLYTLYMPWYNTITFFWFLPTLFLIFLLANTVVKHDDSIVYDTILFMISVFLWFTFPNNPGTSPLGILNIGGVLHNIIFFIGGFLICKYELHFVKFNNMNVVLTCVMSILFYNFFLNYKFAHLVIAILGIFFVYGIASSIPTGILMYFGDYSYQIYIFSWFPQVAIRITLSQVLHVNIWVVVISSFIGGLFFPIFLTRFLNSIMPEWSKKIYGI
jgi:fucose 4-O-acetylase-like acetyltransferase